MESIISALIAGGLALVGVVITSMSANKKIETQLMTNQAVTNTKIESLTEEVRRIREHNDRITRLEVRVDTIEHSMGGE